MGHITPASAPADSFFVYILRCSDGTFYIGHTSNVEDRVKLHNDGRGALWTACRRPVTLVHKERRPSELDAIRRERAGRLSRRCVALGAACGSIRRRFLIGKLAIGFNLAKIEQLLCAKL